MEQVYFRILSVSIVLTICSIEPSVALRTNFNEVIIDVMLRSNVMCEETMLSNEEHEDHHVAEYVPCQNDDTFILLSEADVLFSTTNICISYDSADGINWSRAGPIC